MADARTLYIDLLRRSLRGTLHPSYAMVDHEIPELMPGLRQAVGDTDTHVVRPRQAADRRVLGVETMLGRAALSNLDACARAVIRDNVPGDFIETGVWRGGAAILMRGILRAYDITDRLVFAADSFEGLPRPDSEQYPADAGDRHHRRDFLAVSLEEVQTNFRAYDLLDDQVRFLKGWFRDTLPTVADRTWAIVRLDGDMYESTMDGLRNLYHGLSQGGYLIVDDYGSVEACAQAVEDFRRDQGITEPLQRERAIAWSAARAAVSQAQHLQELLGLTDEELLAVLDEDPLTVLTGELEHKLELPILLDLLAEAEERAGAPVLRRWVRAQGPAGRPLDSLLARDFGAFEDALARSPSAASCCARAASSPPGPGASRPARRRSGSGTRSRRSGRRRSA